MPAFVWFPIPFEVATVEVLLENIYVLLFYGLIAIIIMKVLTYMINSTRKWRN
jgi:fatty-acid desaturase